MFNLDVLFSVSNIILFMAIFTRLSGLFASAPLFSKYPIPVQVKIWLCAAIAFILFITSEAFNSAKSMSKIRKSVSVSLDNIFSNP